MTFDKPKVTIDLEEYNYLKEKVSAMDSEQMTIVAQKIIYWFSVSMITPIPKIQDVKSQLAKEGIHIYQRPNTSVEDNWKAIDIRIDKKQ